MWLKFGVSPNNILVPIADVSSGKTNLTCPYCGGLLVAKKGSIKEHHFSHAKSTCYPVATKREFPILPLYDNFNIKISGKSLQLLKELWISFGKHNWGIPFLPEISSLVKAGVLKKNITRQPPSYDFTELGKIPVGMLELVNFNQVQEPLWLKKLADLERQTQLAQVIQKLNLKERLVDLQLYRAQYKYVLLHRLYYLKLEVDGDTLYKIGVTKRSIEERLIEIKRDLRSHYKTVEINVLGTWENRGNVELYFKHRYKQFNYPIGSLTEYYKFTEADAANVWKDLNQMHPKELNAVERNIMGSDSSLVLNI